MGYCIALHSLSSVWPTFQLLLSSFNLVSFNSNFHLLFIITPIHVIYTSSLPHSNIDRLSHVLRDSVHGLYLKNGGDRGGE